MEDVVTARADYSRLDHDGNPVRIRLNSTAVRGRHQGDPDNSKAVEVAYARGAVDWTLGRAARTSRFWWIVLGYLLSLAVWIPASGWIGDRFGTKRTFLFALAMFTLASPY